MRDNIVGLAALVGIAALAFGLYWLVLHSIPPGGPVARETVVEAYNDPNDLSPREPTPPAGPHLDVFRDNCIACHSTRLTLTQPSFPKTKWAEVVHKMVATYGAKITPDLEGQIVEYLVAVKGTK